MSNEFLQYQGPSKKEIVSPPHPLLCAHGTTLTSALQIQATEILDSTNSRPNNFLGSHFFVFPEGFFQSNSTQDKTIGQLMWYAEKRAQLKRDLPAIVVFRPKSPFFFSGRDQESRFMEGNPAKALGPNPYEISPLGIIQMNTKGVRQEMISTELLSIALNNP